MSADYTSLSCKTKQARHLLLNNVLRAIDKGKIIGSIHAALRCQATAHLLHTGSLSCLHSSVGGRGKSSTSQEMEAQKETEQHAHSSARTQCQELTGSEKHLILSVHL